ncbi:hypothetical protein [Halomonas koreensis]|uniref:Uncharacterized protein n=1 Tax=Halomonas koreensis TaxID=245385 RepID=A0ABU1G5H1_9GAMM|nr:hypothetical protein [Halomonas koreensis]MDR5867946.1 hypothetical protein [Halomonas koreensis]
MKRIPFWLVIAGTVAAAGLVVWQIVELALITDALFDALAEAKEVE